MNKWREFANLIEAPYEKIFSTNGWGDFKIDKQGLHHYNRNGEQYMNSDYENELYIKNFLSGDITVKRKSVYSIDGISSNKKYNILDIRLKECITCPFNIENSIYPYNNYCKSCKSLFNKKK